MKVETYWLSGKHRHHLTVTCLRPKNIMFWFTVYDAHKLKKYVQKSSYNIV